MVNSLVVGMWGTSFVDCGTARSHSRAVGENSVDMRVDAYVCHPQVSRFQDATWARRIAQTNLSGMENESGLNLRLALVRSPG